MLQKKSFADGMITLSNAYFFDDSGNEFALNQEVMLNENDDFDFIKRLRTCKLKKGKRLDDYINYINESNIVSSGREGYLVLVTWTIYAGDINAAFAFKWARLIEDAKEYNVDIECYLLNCDMLRHWDYSEFKMESEKNE